MQTGCFTVRIEAAISYEMLVPAYQIKRRHLPEEHNVHLQHGYYVKTEIK
jgi:hypothetical protein